jgi:hypothetical protein
MGKSVGQGLNTDAGENLKSRINPILSRRDPGGFWMLRLPEFIDNPHAKVAKLSALCTGNFYP